MRSLRRLMYLATQVGVVLMSVKKEVLSASAMGGIVHSGLLKVPNATNCLLKTFAMSEGDVNVSS